MKIGKFGFVGLVVSILLFLGSVPVNTAGAEEVSWDEARRVSLELPAIE